MMPSYDALYNALYDAIIMQEEALGATMALGNCPVCLGPREHMVVNPACGHMLCNECSRRVRVCPICRVPVANCIRVFHS